MGDYLANADGNSHWVRNFHPQCEILSVRAAYVSPKNPFSARV